MHGRSAPAHESGVVAPFSNGNGARALGHAGKLGELSPGSRADLVVLPVSRLGRDPYATALSHTGPVGAVMINGRWIQPIA